MGKLADVQRKIKMEDWRRECAQGV